MNVSVKLVGVTKETGRNKWVLEITEANGTHTVELGIENFLTAMKHYRRAGIEVEISEDYYGVLPCYYEFQEDLDNNSGEYDVYLHELNNLNDVITFDLEGQHVKTYKTKSGAVKFAKRLTDDNEHVIGL